MNGAAKICGTPVDGCVKARRHWRNMKFGNFGALVRGKMTENGVVARWPSCRLPS
jgi:hypothetical protein